MTVRDAVKTYQRRLVELDDNHSRAKDRLDTARGRRAELVEQQDQAVAAAEEQVEKTVAEMATEIGADLTASLLDVDAGHVRRLLKRHRPLGPGSKAGSPPAPLSSGSGERADGRSGCPPVV